MTLSEELEPRAKHGCGIRDDPSINGFGIKSDFFVKNLGAGATEEKFEVKDGRNDDMELFNGRENPPTGRRTEED